MTSHSKPLSRMKSLSTITLAFTSLLLLSCFAIATLAWLSLTQSRVHYRKFATTTAQNICTVLADNLVTSYEKIDLAVLEVRDEVERQIASGHLDARRLEARIAGLRARVPVLHALRVVDAEGVVRHGDLPRAPRSAWPTGPTSGS